MNNTSQKIPLPVHWLARVGQVAGVMLILFSRPHSALAALGEQPTSFIAEQTQTQSAAQITQAANYTVQQIVMPSGTVVKEYVLSNGNVFAVAWSGPSMPDLRQLLGQYFDGYTAAAKQKRSGRGKVVIEQPELVVRSGGHMHAFSGSAYLPALLPEGFSAKEIR
jgi:Protein of unknown function (DUF2844)